MGKQKWGMFINGWGDLTSLQTRIMWRNTKVLKRLQLHFLHQMRHLFQYQGPWRVELYFTAIWVLSDSVKLGQNIQIMLRDKWKVIHGLQFHISHQLRTDFYIKFIWGFSYNRFMNIREILGNWAWNYE